MIAGDGVADVGGSPAEDGPGKAKPEGHFVVEFKDPVVRLDATEFEVSLDSRK